jgi:protein dithiol oxidoreductase (disulfide-forming)
MLKRLPFLCAALLALAACSHDNGNPSAASPAAATTTPAAAPASTAAAATATNTASPVASSVPTPASTAPAAAASTPAPASNAAPAAPFVDNGKWVEGKDYTVIDPAQPKLTGTDKVEVVEAFSYGCPACNAYHPTMNELVKELPSNAVVAFLPASFMPQENWPNFQRAYLTAQVMGVADKGNDAMYEAVWNTKELSSESESGGLKPKEALPTIDDMAKVYAKFGADPKEFVATANSFSINTKMSRSDELMKAYGVQGTPTLIIDGKYRIEPLHFRNLPDSIELVKWLISKEAAGK